MYVVYVWFRLESTNRWSKRARGGNDRGPRGPLAPVSI